MAISAIVKAVNLHDMHDYRICPIASWKPDGSKPAALIREGTAPAEYPDKLLCPSPGVNRCHPTDCLARTQTRLETASRV